MLDFPRWVTGNDRPGGIPMAITRLLLIGALLTLATGPAMADAATQAYAQGQDAYGRGDYAAAVEAWRHAARLGNSAAEFRLGAMYEEGKGVDADPKQAVQWYRRAAQHGSERAQFNLAHMYASGTGVEKNEGEAAKWYRRSAERGNAHAQYALGLIYYRGIAVQRDLVEAYAWLTVAAHNFKPNAFRDNADEVRDQIRREMTPAQLKAARDRVDEWASARD